MVHGEGAYRLYLRQLGNPTQLYQFVWDSEANQYTPGPNPESSQLKISGFPDDTDWSRWSMLHDGENYRIYAFKLGSNNEIYQGAWNGSEYKYGYNNSYKVLSLKEIPSDSNLASIEMLHDGSDYRLYMQTL